MDADEVISAAGRYGWNLRITPLPVRGEGYSAGNEIAISSLYHDELRCVVSADDFRADPRALHKALGDLAYEAARRAPQSTPR